MIIIGSTAIKYHFPDFTREPKDLDIIGSGFSFDHETLRTELLTNTVLANRFPYNIIRGVLHLNPNELLTLKMSHLFWNINWDKHMFDVQFLLKKGCKLDKELFYELYFYWNTVHGTNHRSDLEMSATEFFDNALKDYDHDYLHTLLKDVPTYTKVLKDGAEVDVSEDKFNFLTEEEKENLVREEVMIMAFERYQHLGYKIAYSRMLRKFIMNHAPMWEAIWIIQNYIKLHKPKFNFITHLHGKLNQNSRLESAAV